MTNKEAIWIINNRLNTYYCTDDDLKALDKAIKALEQMDSCPVFSDNEVKQPCIESPCVIPKKGKWITRKINYFLFEECDQCHCNVGTVGMNFCPNCGADMRGVKDE